MAEECAESSADGTDECECGGLRDMLWLGGDLLVNDAPWCALMLLRHDFHAWLRYRWA